MIVVNLEDQCKHQAVGDVNKFGSIHFVVIFTEENSAQEIHFRKFINKFQIHKV